MRRREFITVIGGAAVACPLTARAQRRAIPVIGYLSSSSPGRSAERLLAFHQGLSEAGYVQGRTVTIEYRWAGDQYDRLPAMAADLVSRQVAVIVATGATPCVFAAKAATTTIPIVSTMAVDPVQAGLVASLSHPGGNLTGAANLNVELMPKRFELLHELIPTATLIAALVNPTNRAAETQTKDLGTAAGTLGLNVQMLHANTERDFAGVFEALMKIRAGGLVIAGDGFLISRSEQLAALTIEHAILPFSRNRHSLRLADL